MRKILGIIMLIMLLTACSKEEVILDTPSNLRYEDETIKVEDVANANCYVFVVNGVEYRTEANYLHFNEIGTHIVKVKATSIKDNILDSKFTEELTFTLNPMLELSNGLTYNYYYNKSSNEDLVLKDFNFDIKEIVIEHTNEILNDNFFNENIISKDFLLDIETEVVLTIHTIDNYEIKVNILISNNNNPYLIINRIPFDSKEGYTFISELNGATILLISGQNIDESNYTINDNKIIIKNEFVANLFEWNERKNLILTVMFEKTENNVNNTYISYLTIYKK